MINIGLHDFQACSVGLVPDLLPDGDAGSSLLRDRAALLAHQQWEVDHHEAGRPPHPRLQRQVVHDWPLDDDYTAAEILQKH